MLRTEAAQKLVEGLREKLGDSLRATDVWEKGTGKSLAGHNTQPAATKLFDEFYNYIETNLRESKFPSLSRYFLLELENENAVVVINYGKLLQGMLVNLSSANMGKVVSLTIPKMLRDWEGIAKYVN